MQTRYHRSSGISHPARISRAHRPAWWQLYLIVPLMFMLLLAAHLTEPGGVDEEIVDIGILLASFGGMLAWIYLNLSLIERDDLKRDQEEYVYRITVYEPRTGSQDMELSGEWRPAKAQTARSPREQVKETDG